MTIPLPEDNPENVAEVDPVDEAATPSEAPAVEDRKYASEMLALHMQGRRGANWFYWVAGLSLVNTAITLLGGNIYFIIGLGVTMSADIVATLITRDHPNAELVVKGIAFTFDLFVALILAGFGWLSGRGYLAVFVLGMILYLLDGLIWVFAGDWLSVAFHGYALFCMWSGFQAFRRLRVLEMTIPEPEEGGPESVPTT